MKDDSQCPALFSTRIHPHSHTCITHKPLLHTLVQKESSMVCAQRWYLVRVEALCGHGYRHMLTSHSSSWGVSCLTLSLLLCLSLLIKDTVCPVAQADAVEMQTLRLG